MSVRWTEQHLADYVRRTRSSNDPGPPHHPDPKPIASPAPSPKARRAKFNNRKVTDAEGNVHDSSKEYRLWCELQLRERAGEIRRLRRQVPFALVVNGVLVCRYVADFVYDEGEAKDIVVDCKSPPTRKLAAYAIKRNLMLACHGIQIREM